MQCSYAGLLAPTFLKRSVDALSGTITQTAVNACVAALAWSGVCRVVNSIAREAQGPIFTPVAQVHHIYAFGQVQLRYLTAWRGVLTSTQLIQSR